MLLNLIFLALKRFIKAPSWDQVYFHFILMIYLKYIKIIFHFYADDVIFTHAKK